MSIQSSQKVDDTDPRFQYDQGWRPVGAPGDFDGTHHEAFRSSAQVKFGPFQGMFSANFAICATALTVDVCPIFRVVYRCLWDTREHTTYRPFCC